MEWYILDILVGTHIVAFLLGFVVRQKFFG